jgi:hypothetical protein
MKKEKWVKSVKLVKNLEIQLINIDCITIKKIPSLNIIFINIFKKDLSYDREIIYLNNVLNQFILILGDECFGNQ